MPQDDKIWELGNCKFRNCLSISQFSISKFQNLVERLWNKDASLWKSDSDHQAIIKDRLGWLTVAQTMQKEADPIHTFSLDVKGERIKDVVLLGMGGSSLCPDVLRETFGKIEGFPELHILDTTDPSTIANCEKQLDLKKTLWIVSSKSGGTTETDSLFHYFFDKTGRGKQYIAITDPDTSLEKMARAKQFRKIFRNPSDIGGRYCALSFFGLVPASLMGLDIRKLLDSARAMVDSCRPSAPAAENPGAVLGACLGELYARGRDKVTFVVGKPIETFGYWTEQLLAESTGKEGKGLVPVEGEALGPPEVYGHDRVFVHIYVRSSPDEKTGARLKALEAAGHPVIEIALESPYDLGGEFFRFEFATAVTGSMMQIDAFDQPNVQESKDNTKALLETFEKQKSLPEEPPLIRQDGLSFYGPTRPGSVSNLAAELAQFVQSAKPGDYVALMAYLERSSTTQPMLDAIRLRLRDGLRAATTLGYGPRFLHSTGQLHKGGANNGLFIQFTADDPNDLKIPGEPYGFSTLKKAQALGDYASLLRHGRRLIRIHLGKNADAGLEKVSKSVEEVVAVRR